MGLVSYLYYSMRLRWRFDCIVVVLALLKVSDTESMLAYRFILIVAVVPATVMNGLVPDPELELWCYQYDTRYSFGHSVSLGQDL